MQAQLSSYGQDLRRARHSSFHHGELPKHSFHSGRDVERYAMNTGDYTAASMGKFSECLFQSGLNHSLPPQLSSKSDLSVNLERAPNSSSASLPAFTRSSSSHLAGRNTRSATASKSTRNLHERDDGKRLVHQFFNLDDDFPDKPDVQVSHASEPSSVSLHSQDESLCHLVLADLKDRAAIHEGALRNKTCCRPDSHCESTPTLTNELSKFNLLMRSTLSELASRESAMNQSFAELESLQRDIATTQESIRQIQDKVAQKGIEKVRSAFETNDNNSFISKFTKNISSYSEDLTAFEKHIGKCKVELTDNKATVHNLEITIKLNEMLRDSQSSMCVVDRLREYRGIITDVLTLILIVALAVALKRYWHRT
ncbi:LANO_0C02080g1_1 [Lachancea nothofagi CBS 11611]|uniref:LANO_0C02080g1_1 n=1 Tax=Lachancea nothofagi CBS 11611 TaxID=1266666 RepID=A0A1G4J4R5_9SACH|nr:LANO_0C02080g1_1 [Lachancea nothofagi CBS 11611]